VQGAASKKCTHCGEIKDLAEFSFKNEALGRRQPFCRTCHKEWNRQHYERNKATYIATAKRNSARYYAESGDRILEYLRNHPCVDCGEADPLVLEFDHRDRSIKRLAISAMLSRFGWAEIEREIDKCDVRCANCHRRRTALQLGYRKAALVLALGAGASAGAAGLEPATSDFGDRRSTN
jgi:hypothetical protein